MRAPVILILAGLLALVLQLVFLQSSPPADAGSPLEQASDLPARRPRASRPLAPLADAAIRAPYSLQSGRSPFDLSAVGGGAAPASGASDSFGLVGLIRGAGSASAIVRDPSGGSHVLRPGDTLLGWRLDGVGRDDVALSRGAERRTLTLNGPPAVLNRTSP